MAFTRKTLKAMGLTDEPVESAIELHTDVVDALKLQRDQYKADADKLPGVQEELDAMKGEDGGYKEKYEAEKSAHDALKQKIETEKANAGKDKGMRKLLKESGVNREEFVELLMGKVALDAVEMDGDKVKNGDAIISPLKTAYAGCFGTVQQEGTPPVTPPPGNGTGGKSRIAQIAAEYNRSHYGEQKE